MPQSERKRRGNSRYMVYFVIALVFTIAISVGIYHALLHVSWFNLQKIVVTNNQSVPTEMIHDIVAKYLNMNLLSIPSKEIQKDILSISRVKSVRIRKSLLHTLRIEVQERSGFLYVKSLEGDLYPIDSDGVVMEKLSPYYNEDLPILNTFISAEHLELGSKLEKPYINKVLSIHKEIGNHVPEFLAQISEYFIVDDIVYIIDAKYGTRLIPSDDDLISQLNRYMFVQDNGNINRNTTIDLRFKNQVVVKAGK